MESEATPRPEEQVVAATIPVTIGGKEKALRVLPIDLSRKWKAKLLEAGVSLASADFANASDLGAVVTGLEDKYLDLVVAYDELGEAALGGKEYLLRTATDPEVYAAFRGILSVSFPFVRDVRTAIVELRALGVAEMLRASSSPKPSSGESTDGVLASSES